jgi:alpha-tubulin suppressor-like RCC1 family protein
MHERHRNTRIRRSNIQRLYRSHHNRMRLQDTTRDRSKSALNQRTAPGGGGRISFRQVTAGNAHTCGLTPDRHAYCWGASRDGQVGAGTTTTRAVPTAVVGGLSFKQVVAGATHTCGVTPGNQAYCWGDNQQGELGDGTNNVHLKPVAVAGRLVFSGLNPGSGSTRAA